MEYILKTIARSRSVTVRITPEGKIQVNAPRFISKKRIDEFVKKSENWIETQLARHKEKLRRLSAVHGTHSFLYEGKALKVKIVEDHAQPFGVHIHAETISIHPVQHTSSSIARALDRWLRARSEEVFGKRVHVLAAKMKLSYKSVVFKQTSSRWGSCSSSGNMNFNWRLIQAPPEVLDYVIIHELAHLVHMNHSASFWRLVEQFDALYKSHQMWLRRNGNLLQMNIEEGARAWLES